MVANTKKAATVRNLWYRRVAKPVLEVSEVVAAIRAAIVANSLLGEFSEVERNAMLSVESALNAMAVLPGITAAEEKYIPGHLTEQDTVGLEV